MQLSDKAPWFNPQDHTGEKRERDYLENSGNPGQDGCFRVRPTLESWPAVAELHESELHESVQVIHILRASSSSSVNVANNISLDSYEYELRYSMEEPALCLGDNKLSDWQQKQCY